MAKTQKEQNILGRIGSFIIRMCNSSTKEGAISSKIVIGSITYLTIVISMVTLAFVRPNFPGLDDIIITLSITSASLLGLTAYENIKTFSSKGNRKKIHQNDD